MLYGWLIKELIDRFNLLEHVTGLAVKNGCVKIGIDKIENSQFEIYRALLFLKFSLVINLLHI
jgi:hypothetical protein